MAHAISILRNLILLAAFFHDAEVVFYVVWSVIMSVAMIVSMVFVLSVKKIGIYLFFLIQLVNTIGLCVVGQHSILFNIGIGLVMCAFFSALLCLKANKRSAWKTILGGKGLASEVPQKIVEPSALLCQKANKRSAWKTILDDKGLASEVPQKIVEPSAKKIKMPKFRLPPMRWPKFRLPRISVKLKKNLSIMVAVLLLGVGLGAVVYFLAGKGAKKDNGIYIMTYTLTTSNGESLQVGMEKVEKNGMDAFAKDYPGATLRMRDADNKDYDIPLYYYADALKRGLRPFRTKHLLAQRGGEDMSDSENKKKARLIDFTITTSDGKRHQLGRSFVEKYGMDSYARDYPGATIRMRDKQGQDYDIPLDLYETALKGGLHPFRTEYVPVKRKDKPAPTTSTPKPMQQPASVVLPSPGVVPAFEPDRSGREDKDSSAGGPSLGLAGSLPPR